MVSRKSQSLLFRYWPNPSFGYFPALYGRQWYSLWWNNPWVARLWMWIDPGWWQLWCEVPTRFGRDCESRHDRSLFPHRKLRNIYKTIKASSTHWAEWRIYASANYTIIGSNKCLSPGRRQAITLTKDIILLTGPLGTKFSEIDIYTFSFKKMHLKMSGKCRPFFSASMFNIQSVFLSIVCTLVNPFVLNVILTKYITWMLWVHIFYFFRICCILRKITRIRKKMKTRRSVLSQIEIIVRFNTIMMPRPAHHVITGVEWLYRLGTFLQAGVKFKPNRNKKCYARLILCCDYPSQYVDGGPSVEVWEWVSNVNPHFWWV